jgi:hypothetical protein
VDAEVLEYKRTPQTVKPYVRGGTLKTPSGDVINCRYEQSWLPIRAAKIFVEGWQISIPLVDGEPQKNNEGNVLKFISLVRFESK